MGEQLVVIESETGPGKTEAALLRFARLYEARLVGGLNFALPTRAAAVQTHGRVNDFAARLISSGTTPETVLAVPSYLRAGASIGRHLQDFDVWWDDDVHDGVLGIGKTEAISDGANRGGYHRPGNAWNVASKERSHVSSRPCA